jgi:hypothetical protein
LPPASQKHGRSVVGDSGRRGVRHGEADGAHGAVEVTYMTKLERQAFPKIFGIRDCFSDVQVPL